LDPIEIHRFGLAGRETLLLLLASSLVTLVGTRAWTRLARNRGWRSGRLGDVHVHHLVVGIVLVLVTGMLDLAMRPGELGRESLAIVFGAGAALILDEFALSVHLQDVYWTAAGRRSIEISLMWMLLGLLLLVGISPFGIHDQSAIPRLIGFVIVAINILLSLITCLKGKLLLGLLSIFLPPVGLAGAIRLARPGSVWAAVFYRRHPVKQERAGRRFHPALSRNERLRRRTADFIGGRHDLPTKAASR
jgi:predicted MFS family arabinose efflux permease